MNKIFLRKTTQTINANKNAAERFKVIANAKKKVECKFLIR